MKRYYQKQKSIAVLAVTAALLLAGCSENPGDNQPQIVGEPAPLGVNVEVTPQSRSVVTGTAFNNGSRINIILHDAGETTIYQGISQPYEFRKTSDTDPGMWIPTASEGLMVSELAGVYAHYPAILPTGEATLSADNTSIDVTLPASRDLGAIDGTDFESFFMTLKTGAAPTEILTSRSELDLMTGLGTQVTTAGGGSKATTIGMKHALAMVIVYVKKSPYLLDVPNVKAITIQNVAPATPLLQGSFLLADNSFTPNTTQASYTRTMSGFPVDMAYYAMTVYPATMEEGAAEMILKVDDTSHAMPMPAKTWAPGKVYIYNVEISANKAQIGAVTLTDWPEWIEKPFDLE